MTPTRLIIAGGRNTVMTQAQWDTLVSLSDLIDEVVSGGASGIDSWGELFAGKMGLPCRRFDAQWEKYGPSAGPIRNGKMRDYANALAIFDGGSGSADMYNKAVEAGLWIWDFRTKK